MLRHFARLFTQLSDCITHRPARPAVDVWMQLQMVRLFVRPVAVLVVAGALLWLATPAHAQEVSPASADVAAGWTVIPIEGTPLTSGVTEHGAAIGADGRVYASFYDAISKDLLFAATTIPETGNCNAAGRRFYCDYLDAANDTGIDSDVAIYPGLDLPAVAYIDASENAIYYGLPAGCPNGICGNWVFTKITTGFSNFIIVDVDLAFAPDGTPHIAYRENLNSQGKDANIIRLRYARFVGTGNGANCLSNAWTCMTVDDTERGVISMSLSVAGNGRARIAYSRYRMNGDLFAGTKLVYAAYVGQSGGCGEQVGGQFTWQCHDLASYADYVPVGLSLAMDGSEPHLALVEMGVNVLKYMTLDFQDLTGNCGPANQWHCSNIESIGNSLEVSVAFDGARPAIAYIDANDISGRDILKLARPITSPGNCGPGDLFFTWDCLQVDNGARPGSAQPVRNFGGPVLAWNALRNHFGIVYGDKTENTLLLAQEWNASPGLTSLSHYTGTAGAADVVVTVTGNNFNVGSKVYRGNTLMATGFTSSTKLTFTMPLTALAAGALTLTVCNTAPAPNDCSNAVTFTVEAAAGNGGGNGNGQGGMIYLYLPAVIK
jgi:hypothetical protein